MFRQLYSVSARGVLALALVAATLPVCFFTPRAYAWGEADLSTQVEQTAAAYDEALAEQDRIATEMADLNADIDSINEQLPEQVQRSNDSCVALYKVSAETSNIIFMLLNSQSITEAIAIFDAYSWIIDSNLSEVTRTASLKSQLEESYAQLEEDMAVADEATVAAANALTEAQEAREKAQAEAAAAQAAEAEAQAAAQSSSSSSSSSTESASSESTSAASTSNVSWSSDKQAFVDSWAGRIDAYLSGTPMAGCGQAYAAAAWDYGVDPRWAPAISYVESGVGNACFRSYNAWGYGSSGYSSWTEGINAVCKGLGGSLYGGYLTMAAAETYCPTNPSGWYNECAAQMALI